MQLVTADEFVNLHKEFLTAIRENDKLKEQLNTAKKALREIQSIDPSYYDGNNVHHLKYCAYTMKGIAKLVLAAIGEEDNVNKDRC